MCHVTGNFDACAGNKSHAAEEGSVANSVYSAYMVENMPYGIVLYKEYRYCMMPYYGIKVWPYIVDMVDTASVNHVFNVPRC
jgi:hypothetical protein